MSQDSNEFDPWALDRVTLIDAGPKLTFETIPRVEPLDAQFGVMVQKTVPDALDTPLFDQPEPTRAELEAAQGDPTQVPPMQTYAILDAAKVTNLAVTIETSGLKHRCLFKGAAYDNLKDVAPWIVQLEDGNKFTRQLFTQGKAPTNLWDSEAGIYLRSRSTIDDLRDHFRKFTKVQDENEKWYYFRFWEPKTVEQMFAAFGNAGAQRFLAPCSSLIILTVKPQVVCKRISLKNELVIS